MFRSAFAILTCLGFALSACDSGGDSRSQAPAPLSAQKLAPSVDSDYGSGNYGRWRVDEFGLPVFRYDLDQVNDPRGKNPEKLLNVDRSQHQVGNDHIKGFSWNEGSTTLWSQARLAQWANVWEPEFSKWSGGYGYLHVDGKTISTFYLDRPAESEYERYFGVGYFEKRVRAEQLEINEKVYAPFGDDPLLLHDVTIRNLSNAERSVSWFEYWDVNPYNRTLVHNRGIGSPVWNAAAQTLSVAQLPDGGDLRPLTIFAAALQGPLSGFETLLPQFFGLPASRAAPAAVVANTVGNSIAPPSPTGLRSQTVFVFRAPLILAPGESVSLRYAYGMTHTAQIPELVTRYRTVENPFAASQRAWRDWLPRADFGDDYKWVARELMWDAYLLRSATVYEEECGAHTITQGGYYQYSLGANLGYRSWLHYLLPITYTEPWLAREILRYSIKLQPELVSGFVPYGTGPLCTRFDLGTSNDLDFWLLLAAGEYGLGMRDLDFFDESLPFYDTKREVSAWDHLKLSYQHQESMRGPNGGYIMGTTGDWSDFATPLGPMTESMLVAAQLAYAYPKLAELAELRGDMVFATELYRRGAELKETVAANWTGQGWYARGYFLTQQIGKGLPYGEPQPWAILAGVPSAEQAAALVSNIRRFLTGIGAPGGPSLIGSAMAPTREDPDITERGPAIDPTGLLPDLLGAVLAPVPNAPLAGAAAYPGGVWFDINGHLTWALGELDGIVPGAREFAWDEYTRNTLANHANVFPDHWNGTISIDDACNAWYSTDPSRCGIGVPTWIGNITEQPTWMVMNAIRLAGITSTRDGFRIAPHFPFNDFALNMPRVGIESRARQLRGYFKVEQDGPLQLRVRLPAGAGNAAAFANSQPVASSFVKDELQFTLPARANQPADWAVRW